MNENVIEEIKIGDTVRSYDFEHRTDCYFEGVVEGIKDFGGCHHYVILCTKQVWANEERDLSDEPRYVHPPVNGTPATFGGTTNFVTKI